MITNLTEWQLAGYYPFTPLLAQSAEIGCASGCVTPVIPATVPGSIYRDLMAANIIPDPYFERNSLSCEWVKDRFWVYDTKFTPQANEGDRVILHLDGIDYHAHIFVNDQKLGEHENMFVPFVYDITAIVKKNESNSLRVVLESAPDEMSQIGYTERTFTQKARYTYKWDFCTRLVGMGLWGKAWVGVYPGATIGYTKAVYKNDILTYTASIDQNALVSFRLSFEGKTIFEDTVFVEGDTFEVSKKIENPCLWYPSGIGAQPLYDIDLTVSTKDGVLSDEKHERVGLRTLQYVQCAEAREDSLPYIPVVNGKKVYIKGVNCTPMDLMTGTESPEKRRKMLTLVRDMGCNLVRVWGGGVIESEDFYNLCDELGLMIWQEMPQSSSGISNVPSKDPHFLQLLAQTTEFAACARRNHPCLTFFSGGNELTDENVVPSTFEDENIAMIRKILLNHAPEILMLPTSASGPTEYGLPDPKANHDVHGPWKYCGPEEQYRRFNSSSIQLHSEFGADGMTNYETLPLFLSEENRKGIDNVRSNLTWRHHGEWWDTYLYRDCPMFGDMGGDLPTFITVSQYMQAEGLRYALEANRRRQWQCGGSIVWQFNEPWPNVTGTNLVDYTLTPKFAYYFCRDAQKPFHASLRYDKLIYTEGETFTAQVYLHDDFAEIPAMPIDKTEAKIAVTLLDENGIPKEAVENGELSFPLERLGSAFRIRLEVSCGEKTDKSEYLFFIAKEGAPRASVSAVKRFVSAYMNKETRK